MRRRRVLSVAAAAMLAAGCGTSGTGTAARGDPSPTAAASTAGGPGDWQAVEAHALAAWAAFPVDAAPRPLVVISGDLTSAIGGFRSGDAKLALLSGVWTGPTPLPSSPPEFDGYPVIGVQEALEEFRSTTSGNAGLRSRVRAPLTITKARLVSDRYRTDRGEVSLPTWLFTFTGASGAAPVTAVSPPTLFPAPGDSYPLDAGPGVAASEGGRRLTFTVFFPPPGGIDPGSLGGYDPCAPWHPGQPSVQVLESGHGVAFHIRWDPGPATITPTRSPNGTCSSTAPPPVQVGVELGAPLGNRVLLGVDGRPDGAPVQVTGLP